MIRISVKRLWDTFGDKQERSKRDFYIAARALKDYASARFFSFPCEILVRTDTWIRQCYHAPSRHEIIMDALDDLIGGYGVEGLNDAVEYVNMGDPYVNTVLYVAGSYRIGNWGDIAEKMPYEEE
jgi:hypothetical protein